MKKLITTIAASLIISVLGGPAAMAAPKSADGTTTTCTTKIFKYTDTSGKPAVQKVIYCS